MRTRNSSHTQSIPRAVSEAFAASERVVLAVSGGVDSMVMLHAAQAVLTLRQIVVATFDHRTGPAASEAREHVERWCARAGIECVTGRATEMLSTEAALRAARWSFLH